MGAWLLADVRNIIIVILCVVIVGLGIGCGYYKIALSTAQAKNTTLEAKLKTTEEALVSYKAGLETCNTNLLNLKEHNTRLSKISVK